MNFRPMKLRQSLLSKYLLIIMAAILILPFSIIGVPLLLSLPPFQQHKEPNVYGSAADVEKRWHAEADMLSSASDEEISDALRKLEGTYPDAAMFWVDGWGKVKLRLDADESIPEQWSASYTADFMKQSFNSDPFTVVAFIGGKPERGFMVIQFPRSFFAPPKTAVPPYFPYTYIAAMFAILGFFLFVSWMFIYRLRKRLLRLQEAMSLPSPDGIPGSILVGRTDEIGRLEHSFNAMIDQLHTSRKRELEEGNLRRQLIANLSHDLRTPITAIRGHAYSLRKEALSPKGRESVERIDRKIDFMGRLIENLLSYTLLTSGKYPYDPKQTDIVRILRTSCANWYPAFEREDFVFDLDLPDQTVYWVVDPHWLERILDNYFSNILRHAASGKYLGVRLENDNRRHHIVISDHGPGMGGRSPELGAGIGLGIVALMLKEMDLRADVATGSRGTEIRLCEDDNVERAGSQTAHRPVSSSQEPPLAD